MSLPSALNFAGKIDFPRIKKKYTVGYEPEPPEPHQNFSRSRSRLKMMQLRNTVFQ
jgi:hypothetical protein